MTRNKHLLSWLAGALSIAAFQMTPATALGADVAVYSDALANGWQDWSWGTTNNFNNTTLKHDGNAAIAVTFAGGWSGLQLGQPAFFDVAGATALRFWAHGGTSGGQNMVITVCASGSSCQPGYPIPPLPANQWTQVNVPLAGLGGSTVYSIQWFNNTPNAQPTFYVDDIAFVGTGSGGGSGAGPDLSVDAGADRHPISPYIYGMNFADEALAQELRLPVRRWGGNAATRYNWQNDTRNVGGDWFFENISEADPGTLPNGSSADRFVEQDRRTASKTLMTAPLIGWTPKRRSDHHPFDCSFKISKYGAQHSSDPWDSDCGDGLQPNGATPITGNDPQDTSTAITPDFVKSWVAHLIGRYGTAASGGVLFYNLDNEPMLWNSTHRDVHPQPTSYDELRDRTYSYGAAIKAADPGAKTLGPVLWGWCAYFYSAVDNCSSSGADYQAHGNTPFTAWYLQQMRAYEQQYGVRILDYLDLHNYPQANGVALSGAGNSSTQALRLRSTRSLWDPTYSDESWIGQPVSLIPRMRQWVANYYPGTKLAITEYNWGALDHINGALAQADVLGIFGREGLDLATLWAPPTAAQPGAMAFRMYRNYDGAGGSFGDVAVRAASSNQDQLAIYAAEKGQTRTLMILNKTNQDLTSAVTLAGFTPAATAQVYRYSAANLNAIVRQPDQAIGASGFNATFPASSMTLVVIPTNGGGGAVTYSVSTTAGAGGGISPGSATVNQGDTATFTVTPNAGYRINTVTGCGGSLSGNTYTTGAINAACTVNASFTANSYTVTAKAADSNGSISPASRSVAAGATTTFTMKPNTGYRVSSASGCGGSLSGNTYTTGAINADCAVSANFVLKSYTVTAKAGSNGAISPASRAVAHGATTTFTVTPNANYRINTVTGCSGSLSGNTYTTGAINAACTVKASFIRGNP